MVFGRAHGDREGGAPLVVWRSWWPVWSPSMPSAAESSLRFAVSSCGVGSGVIPERWRGRRTSRPALHSAGGDGAPAAPPAPPLQP